MKKQIIIGLSLFACLVLKAQDPGSYLHFNVGGGLHNFSYDLADGTKQNTKIGYTVNAAYSYFFSPHWGVQTGVGAQTFSGLSTLNYLSSTSAVDGLGRSYDFRSNYNTWKEKPDAIFVDVPLLLQYRHNISETFGIIGSIGCKVAIPVYQQFKPAGGEIVTTGYYSQWNTELSDIPKYGFTTINDVSKGNHSLKTSFMAVADFGELIRLSDKTDLYIGCYVNYGLNNVLKSSSKEVYQSDGTYNGVFASTQTTKVIPVTFGVKVGVYLRMRKKDSDHDGVPDSKDKCPNTPLGVKVDLVGCPLDTDGDGIPDYLDKCPNTPTGVAVDSTGCPLDADKDGVPDYLDKCPNTPLNAKVDTVGCPLDSDGDGVPDYRDKCPNTPKEAYGHIDENGCPLDADGDGVPDYLDKCPNTPKAAIGFVDKNGCLLDTDGDGVPDYLDKCPKVAGPASNHGCPEVKKEVKALFKKALQGIQFESGKYIIKPVSFNLLNQIAVMLIANPTYIIEVQGHTDNVGSPESNLILSGKRAEAVKNYLINAGVDAKRLTSHGYGDTVPVSTNTTSAGKKLNRRVEFVVTFEQVVSGN